MTIRRSSMLLALAITSLWPALARADDDLVIGRRARPDFLTLDRFGGSVGLIGLYSQQNVTQRGSSASATNTLMTESLSLNSAGHVFSNNFLSWYGTGTLSLEEQESTGGGQNQKQTGIFDAYDFRTNILKNTQFPVTAYAQRSENFVDRTFASMLRSTTSAYGATARYDSPALPTSLSINHTEITQTDLGGASQYSGATDQVAAQTAFQPFERHQISLDCSYSSTTQNNPGALPDSSLNGAQTNSSMLANEFTTQTAAAAHTWAIDPDSRFVLSEGISYSNETGVFPATSLHLNEGLRMHWTEDLTSALDYSLQKLDNYNSSLTSQSLTASLTHHLFSSLTTNVQTGATFSDNTFTSVGSSGISNGNGSTSTADSYFGNIGTAYTKKMYMGTFGANLGVGLSQSNNSSISQTQQVLNDAHVFTDPQPIILTRTGIDPATIAVFDATGTRLLVKGLDYNVRAVGNTVQVSRIVGGTLDAGDTVRLNYKITPQSAYTSDNTNFNAGMNYTVDEGLFKGLRPYIRYQQVDQTITPESSGLQPDNIRDTTLGADYNIWKLTFNAQDEDRKSTLAPYDALRLSVRYNDTLGDRTTLSLDASQSFITYASDGSSDSLTTASGQLAYQITRDVTSRVLVRWRDENDSIQGPSMGWEEQARIQWKIRQTDIYVMIRHTSMEAGGGSNSSLFLQFGLTRNF